MKRIIMALVAVGALAYGVGVASADSPHFVSASASVNGSGALVVSWKEAGLGNGQLIHYTVTADASAVYGCFNGGGNHPKASNKETVTGTVSASGDRTVGRNGSITSSLTASGSPPGPGDFTCPSGQTLGLISVSYTNIELTDTHNNISVNIPDVSG